MVTYLSWEHGEVYQGASYLPLLWPLLIDRLAVGVLEFLDSLSLEIISILRGQEDVLDFRQINRRPICLPKELSVSRSPKLSSPCEAQRLASAGITKWT